MIKIKNKKLKIVFFILVSEILGSIGSIVTSPVIPTWYAGLIKPSFNPPNFLFGPVWTLLFAMMGYSAYRIYEKGLQKKEVKEAFTFFVIQFLLNIIWSFIFFGANMLYTAFTEIVLLWIFILATIIKFYRIDKTAAYLLIPYFLWVTFASILNYSIAVLNPF